VMVIFSDVDHFLLVHQLLHRLPDLLPRRLPVDVVHLVEVEMVRLQAAQTLVAGRPDVQCRQPRLIRPVAHFRIHLGRQDDFVAASTALGELPANDLLGDAFAPLEEETPYPFL
jgi:hypothetical protein